MNQWWINKSAKGEQGQKHHSLGDWKFICYQFEVFFFLAKDAPVSLPKRKNSAQLKMQNIRLASINSSSKSVA